MNKEELEQIRKAKQILVELELGLINPCQNGPDKLGGHKVDQGDGREILGRINFVTPKAIQVSYQDKLVWVPKSTLKAQVDESNTTEPQMIILASWIYEKHWGGS